MQQIRKFLDDKAGVRVAFVNATAAVREMQRVQNASPVATLLVGRAMVGAALLASHLKDGEVVSLYFSGNGPIGKVFAEANFEGGVRGYASVPQVDVPVVNNQPSLSAVIGKGLLSVVRTHPMRKTPHRGTVEIQTGEVGEDIAFYLQQSEQTRSAIMVGVKIDEKGHVEAAGGILIELLPAATVHIEIMVEDQFMHAGSVSDALARGDSVETIMDRFLGSFQLRELPHPFKIEYTCKCSRNRLLRAMEIFPEKDLDDILAKKKPVTARCEFCGREYTLELAEIGDIRKRRFHDGKH